MTLDGYAGELALRPTWKINDMFDLFARVGWDWYKINIDAGGFGSTDTTDNDFVWGLGGTWQMTPHWGLRGEYSALNISGGDLDMWTLSVLFKFR